MCINKYLFALFSLATFGLVFLTSSCKGDSESMQEDHSHAPSVVDIQAPGMLEEVTLTTDQMNNIGLTFTALTPRKIRSTVKLTGRVELPPTGKAIAGSNLEGKIESVFAMAGRQVQKGQKLFTIQNLEIIDWQQELKMKQAELEFLEKELTRQKQLSQEDIAPLKNYENAQSKKIQMEASVEALRAKLSAIGIQPGAEIQSTFSVLAPMSGVIQHILVSNGQFIDPRTPLAEIISNHHLHVHLTTFGSDVGYLAKDQLLNFFIQSRPTEILRGKILWINAVVDEKNNSYDVHAEIMDDHSRLSAGEFVEARVIDQEQTANTIPVGAVAIDKGLSYIFVREHSHANETHFQKIQIQTGETDLGFVEINPIDPLPVIGDSSIVHQGSYFLMAESKKGEEGAGHEH